MTDIQFDSVKPLEWLKLLYSCADEADAIAMHYFQSDFSVSEKMNNTPVTQADLEIETKIREHVQKMFPGLPILGEEHGQCDESEPFKLIIDPIDATRSFMRGVPFFGSLLAVEVNKVIVAGMVSCPAIKNRWWAAKGEGCFANGKPCKVSTIETLEQSQAFHASLYGAEGRGNTDNLLNLLSKTHRQRGYGDFLIHCFVAQGSGEFSLDFGLAPWDVAPFGVLIPEAGGMITDQFGHPFSPYEGSIVCSNGAIHQEVVKQLQVNSNQHA